MKNPEIWLKLWDKLVKELKVLDDNNTEARKLYKYIVKNFEAKPSEKSVDEVCDVIPSKCADKISMKNGFVFINGYGLVKFKSINKNVFISEDGHFNAQYQGLIKLPKGVTTGDGSKWMDYDYWFDSNKIFNTRGEVLSYLS